MLAPVETMPPKRSASASDAANGDGSGFIGGDEFTRAVRRRLSTSTRTGQACDRCKVWIPDTNGLECWSVVLTAV